MSAAGISPGLELAKALLWGIALLGCLVRSAESACGDPAIELTTPSNLSMIRLHCCVTRNMTSFYWTHNGYRLPVSRLRRGSMILEVPLKEATGVFECHVQYTRILSQIATIVLDFSDKKNAEVTTGLVLLIILGVVSFVMIVAYVGCMIRQHQLRYTMRGRRFYRPGSSSDLETTGPGGADTATAAV